jgi:uncharacterized protein (DUF1800 family)
VRKAYYKTDVRLEVFMAATMKDAVFWDVALCGSFRSGVSVEYISSIIRAIKIRELGTLAVTSN